MSAARSRADGGVRDHLAVLADRFQAAGDPWGLWIAALLSGSEAARQEHEAALAAAVSWVKSEEVHEDEAGGLLEAGNALAEVAAGIRAVAAASWSMGRSLVEFNQAMAAVGQALEKSPGPLAGVVDDLRASLDLEIGPARQRQHGPVGDRLRRRLGRGRW